MTAPIKMAKRAAAGTLALAVCLTGGVLAAGSAQAAANFKFDQRISGETRFETAIEASKKAYPNAGQAKAIVLVNGDREVDGLTASYVAGLQDASILYVTADTYSAATKAEMDRLGTKNVFLVGGTTVISNAVETKLKADGFTVTKRYGGDDRYETAAQVAKSGTAKPGKVFIASGERLADALVVGPIAFKNDYPILLVRASQVPASTSSALNDLGVNVRDVIGGKTVIPDSVYNDAKGTTRFAGDDRQGTAIKVREHAVANEGFKKESVALIGSSNSNAADALVAAPFAGLNGIPLLFVDNNGENTTKDYLKSKAGELTGQGFVFGGTNAVSSEAAAAATAAAGGTGTTPPTTGNNQSIAVTPNTTESRTLAAGTQALETGTQADQDRDNRVYTASGLDNSKTYRITLVDSRNIAVDNSGVVTFKSSDDPASRSRFSADTGDDDADIVRINGERLAQTDFAAGDPQTNRRTITARPVNGGITFEIDGDKVGDVTPVVYLNGSAGTSDANGGTSARLETSATQVGQFSAPIEPFGLGGKTTFDAVQAENGANATTAPIETATKDGNFVNTASARFNYDDNDTFRVDAAEVDLAAFEAALSTGDTISVTNYQRDTNRVNVFTLGNGNPGTTTVAAATGTGSSENDVTLTGTNSSAAKDLDQIIIQRATVTDGNIGGYVTIGTINAGDIDPSTPNVTDFRYVDNDRPTGSFVYRAAGLNDGDTGTFSNQSNQVNVRAADATAPTAVDTRLARNGGNQLALEGGDAFIVVGSEIFAEPTEEAAATPAVLDDPLTTNVDESQPAVPATTADVFRLQDGDGTTVDLINGGNSAFTLNTSTVTIGGIDYAAGRVLTVTIDSGVVFDDDTNTPSDGTVEGLSSEALIIVQSGTTDVSGNQLQINGSTDVKIDSE